MNYETKVIDLSGDPDLSVTHVDVRTGSRRRGIVIGVIIALALLVGAALFYMGRGDTKPFQASKASQVPTVTVVAASPGAVQGDVAATGSLAARVTMPVSAVGEGGRVIAVNVQPGQWVGAGQVLAVIDRSVQVQQAASAKANIAIAQADAELAQANLDRALKLVDRGFISKADVDRLTATRDGANARVLQAQAQYRQTIATNARLNIVAPAGGLVLQRNVQPGQVVGGGGATPLFTIAKGGEMELLANLSEDDLAAVHVGSPAAVVPVGTERTFHGAIWQLSPVIDPTSRQGVARIALPYDPAIRPGGFASAQISRGALIAPLLPESAVLSDDKGSFVYVVGPDNKVSRRNVRTGLVTNAGIAIVGGLSGTERVVERAGGFLNPGDKVRPVMASEGGQAQPK